MRSWSLNADDPRTMVLSADFRFCEPDYINDQTWEMESGTGESALMAVRTTYGLRARNMRIFPAFSLGGKKVINPELFFSPPILTQFYSNFLEFTCSPFQGLDVRLEYRVPSSQTLASRLTFRNLTTDTLELKFDLNAMMTPIDGQPLASTQMQSVYILSGKTSDLEPVVFLTGGPLRGPGPYPSLQLEFKLAPLETRMFTWVQAALTDAQASFDLARRTAARPWDAEMARIRLDNSSRTVEIETGNPDWDATLAFSQSMALRLFFQAGEHLPFPSFVLSRQPDQGYSARSDGKDYPAQWNGQSVHDAIYLSSLLPGSPDLAAGLVRNFLSTIDEKGFVDCRPGLGGQRGRWLAAPLLAEMAWNIFQQTRDKEFLSEVFPKLMSFFGRWLNPLNDRDQDGFPEWDHPLQTGFEENPLFNSLRKGDQGADIRFFEDPALAACLWKEYHSLVSMADELDDTDLVKDFRVRADDLNDAVKSCWNEKKEYYQYRDRDTHLAIKGGSVISGKGSGSYKPKRVFKQPVRLLIQVWFANRTTRNLSIHIQGISHSGKVAESLERNEFRWSLDGAVGTSRKVYTSLDGIEVSGLQPSDKLVVRSLDYTQQDLTGFLPFWAGFPADDQEAAMVKSNLFNQEGFWQKAGLSTCKVSTTKVGLEENFEVQFPWNQFVGLGLLAYGWRTEASQLMTRLMETAIESLKKQGAFYDSYQAESRAGQGERNSLHGLLPVGLFLRTLGVQILSPETIKLEGFNPYPWPVTLRYRGLVVICQSTFTEVTFPDGKNIRVTDPSPCLVSNT